MSAIVSFLHARHISFSQCRLLANISLSKRDFNCFYCDKRPGSCIQFSWAIEHVDMWYMARLYITLTVHYTSPLPLPRSPILLLSRPTAHTLPPSLPPSASPSPHQLSTSLPPSVNRPLSISPPPPSPTHLFSLFPFPSPPRPLSPPSPSPYPTLSHSLLSQYNSNHQSRVLYCWLHDHIRWTYISTQLNTITT